MPFNDISLSQVFQGIRILIWLFLSLGVKSSPTNSSSPAYVPSPAGRGTVGLLTQCVVTLSLCVWTAIHLNIDSSGKRWRRISNKICWALLAMFAPELVLWRAWSQLMVARKLCQNMNERVGGGWSLQVGFFAAMGGFTVDIEGMESMFHDRTVTPRGVLFLAQFHDELQKVDSKAIKDKSKSDSLAKGLVCIQAGWMMLQTIARKADGLPITLLEVNTLAHVVAAVCMYAVWWYKPQNVNEPITIQINKYRAAIMSQSFIHLREQFTIRGQNGRDEELVVESEPNVAQVSNIETQSISDSRNWKKLIPSVPPDSGHVVDGEPWSTAYWVKRKEEDAKFVERILDFGNIHSDVEKTKAVKNALEQKERGVVLLLPGQWLVGTIFKRSERLPIYLTEPEIQSLILMSAGENPESSGDDRGSTGEDSESAGDLKRYVRHLDNWKKLERGLARGAPNMLIPGNLESSIHLGLFLLAVLSILYGGVHALAWNSHFPSDIEKTLWRISACMITAGGFGVWLVVYIGQYETNSYGFARVYLVTEAFISVRSLPAGAYDTVSWVEFIPHVG